MMSLIAPTRSTTRGSTWCGPYALAVLSGLPYDEAYEKMKRAINRQRGKEAVERGLPRSYWQKKAFKGVSFYEMRIAAKAMGLKIEWAKDRAHRPEHGGVTLLTFVRDHTVKGKTYLVAAGNHYTVIRDGMVYDNTPASPFPIDLYPRSRMARVARYAEVRPKAAALEKEAL